MFYGYQVAISFARACSFAILLLLMLAVFSPVAAEIKVAAMGDSLTDEYSEPYYGTIGNYAQNWVQQLASNNVVNFGPTAAGAGQPGGTWGEPRNSGYDYNWARAGDTSDTLLSDGQASGLAAQIPGQGIGYAVMWIGANDFAPFGPGAYYQIYNGLASQSQIDDYVASRVANVASALDTLQPTGVSLVLGNFVDYGVAPFTSSPFGGDFTDPAKRQLVTNVIQQVNAGILSLAESHHLVYVDMNRIAATIFGTNNSPHSTFLVGNVPINLLQIDTSTGANPTAGFVEDGIHLNTVLQGLVANEFLDALNIGYHIGLPLFTEQQVLAHRGIAYGGSDTVMSQLGSYDQYVTSFVPEPSAIALAVLGGLALIAFRRR